MFQHFWNDESGVIISAEMILILTIGVLSTVVGLSEVACAMNTELNDLSNAFGAFNQSFSVTGFGQTWHHRDKVKGYIAGSTWFDSFDDCDVNSSCDIIGGGGFGGGWGGGSGWGGGGFGGGSGFGSGFGG